MNSNVCVCKHYLDQAQQLKAQKQSICMHTIVLRFALEALADFIRKKIFSF